MVVNPRFYVDILLPVKGQLPFFSGGLSNCEAIKNMFLYTYDRSQLKMARPLFFTTRVFKSFNPLRT